MVHHFTLLLTILIVHLSWCYNEELFYSIPDNTNNLYPEDETDDFDVHRRNSNFLRFGRTSPKMHELEYDDYNEDFARPTRSGKTEKNDYFIRFGRGSKDYLRFGRNAGRGDSHVRYGRSTKSGNKRNKREVFSEFSDNKRGGSNFMRFGRNSNFLRFGRTNEITATNDPTLKISRLDGSLVQLLLQLIENLKKEPNKGQHVV